MTVNVVTARGTVEELQVQGVSHLSLSVTDLERSLAFYRDVLGLAVLREPFDGIAFDGRQAMVLAGRILIGLQQHAGNRGEPFDPSRTGLDHLSFHIGDVPRLEAWVARLDAVGVAHSGVRTVEGFGWMIELRDPDGVQLELFTTKT